MTIENQLNELKQIDTEIANYVAKTKQEIKDIMPQEVIDNIAWLEKQSIDFLEPLTMLRDQLESEIKEAVLTNEKSVKGAYHAIYSKGRESWDTKALNGYALAHPEINELKKIGNPSVRIKR